MIKNRKTGEKFAVKIMIKKKMDEEEKEAVKTEIKILQLLDHPNLVRLIEVFEDEKFWLLIMELME
jgi:serine/threonine protein kinase